MSLKIIQYNISYNINKLKNIIYTGIGVKHADINPRVFYINHEKKIIYVENAKVASRSIVDAMGCSFFKTPQEGVGREKVITLIIPRLNRIGRLYLKSYNYRFKLVNETRTWLKEVEKKEYIIFTFVRDPFNRAVSGYCNKIISTNNTLPLPKQYSDYKSWNNLIGTTLSNNAESFKKFLKNYILKHNPGRIDVHFKPQFNLIYGEEKNKEFKIDFIGKLEKIDSDWEFFCKKYNLDMPKPKRINFEKRKKPYTNYYKDKETIDSIYTYYKKDIEEFGYRDSYKKMLDTI